MGLTGFEPVTLPLSGVRSNQTELEALNSSMRRWHSKLSVKKEVIQPQVPLRLPCYDFAPVINVFIGLCLPFGLA